MAKKLWIQEFDLSLYISQPFRILYEIWPACESVNLENLQRFVFISVAFLTRNLLSGSYNLFCSGSNQGLVFVNSAHDLPVCHMTAAVIFEALTCCGFSNDISFQASKVWIVSPALLKITVLHRHRWSQEESLTSVESLKPH